MLRDAVLPAIMGFRRSLLQQLSLVLLAAMHLSACGVDDSRLRADFDQYLLHEREWAPVEAETARTIERILATQFVDEAEVRRQIDADLPRVIAHLARLKDIRPNSPQLQLIHGSYVDTWVDLRDGYVQLERGLDRGVVSDVAAGRAALQAWRQGILATARAIRALRDDIGA
jgi:hypothetical protein